jgi:hypothetical protein
MKAIIIKYFQIVGIIIHLISINMVAYLFATKAPSYFRLNDKNMLAYVSVSVRSWMCRNQYQFISAFENIWLSGRHPAAMRRTIFYFHGRIINVFAAVFARFNNILARFFWSSGARLASRRRACPLKSQIMSITKPMSEDNVFTSVNFTNRPATLRDPIAYGRAILLFGMRRRDGELFSTRFAH